MKKTTTITEQDRKFLDQLDALTGDQEPSAAELGAELKECGIDPDELQKTTFQAIRARATEKYSSRGVSLPPLMSEALRQMRPPTPEEQAEALTQRATSRVQSFLASLKGVGEAFASERSFAPAYRNKGEDIPESDKEILRDQQKDLDSKRRRKAND